MACLNSSQIPVPVTPMESYSFKDLPSNPFRVYLFHNWGGGYPSLLFHSQVSKAPVSRAMSCESSFILQELAGREPPVDAALQEHYSPYVQRTNRTFPDPVRENPSAPSVCSCRPYPFPVFHCHGVQLPAPASSLLANHEDGSRNAAGKAQRHGAPLGAGGERSRGGAGLLPGQPHALAAQSSGGPATGAATLSARRPRARFAELPPVAYTGAVWRAIRGARGRRRTGAKLATGARLCGEQAEQGPARDGILRDCGAGSRGA